MSASIQELYARYRTELKPLVAAYESENEKFVSTWLDGLSQMFDRVALSETEEDSTMKEEHLEKAFDHLDSTICDARKAVMASMMLYVKKFRKRYSINKLNRIDDGKFVGPFLALEEEIRVIKDKNEELACDKLLEMVNMIKKNRSKTVVNTFDFDGTRTTVLKWLVTILLSIITTYIISLIW